MLKNKMRIARIFVETLIVGNIRTDGLGPLGLSDIYASAIELHWHKPRTTDGTFELVF